MKIFECGLLFRPSYKLCIHHLFPVSTVFIHVDASKFFAVLNQVFFYFAVFVSFYRNERDLIKSLKKIRNWWL